MSWTQELSRSLSRPDGPPPRLAIVGVGQALRGDDAAGLRVAERLHALTNDRLLIVEAGHAPENCLGPIIRFRPDAILFVDAMRANEPPGAIRFIPSGEATDTGGSTHTLSLGMLGGYLALETGARVFILGIQPDSLNFGDELSPAVAAAVAQVAAGIGDYWRKAMAASSAMSTGDVSVVNA